MGIFFGIYLLGDPEKHTRLNKVTFEVISLHILFFSGRQTVLKKKKKKEEEEEEEEGEQEEEQ